VVANDHLRKVYKVFHPETRNSSHHLSQMPPRSNSVPCKFYSMPQGCRKGNSCHFRHDASQTASQVPSGQRSGPLKDRNRGATVTRTPEIPRAPQGVCGFYYTQGSCRRGFDCKFSHTAGPEVTPRSQEYPIPSNPVTGGISPTTSNSPAVSLQWVQKNFRRFLQDEHYRFPSVTHMYSFARILEGVSSSYETWVIVIIPKICEL
jgi:hypothetical protein